MAASTIKARIPGELHRYPCRTIYGARTAYFLALSVTDRPTDRRVQMGLCFLLQIMIPVLAQHLFPKKRLNERVKSGAIECENSCNVKQVSGE